MKSNLELMLSADLTHIPPTFMKAPNKFQWNFKTQFNHSAGSTLRFIIPSGFNALRPICEVVQNVSGVETISTLFYNTSSTNHFVDCLNIPFALTANTLYKFNLDSVLAPDYAGAFSGFTIQIVNGNYPQILETYTNNMTLTILPQDMAVGPAGLAFHRKQDINQTFVINITHEINNPSQIVIGFSNDWILTPSCAILSGLEKIGNTEPTCLKDGANAKYLISNFAKATPHVPIKVKMTLKTPPVGNVNYNVSFTTWDLSVSGKINEKILPIAVNTSSGDAELFKFYSFSSVSKFLPGDAKSLHFNFKLNYTWPDASFTPEMTVEILPKIPDPFTLLNTQLKCEINGIATSSCNFVNTLEDRSKLEIGPVTNLAFQQFDLVITAVDGSGNDVGLAWPHKINKYRAVLTVKRDQTGATIPKHILTANFSNPPAEFPNATLVPMIRNLDSDTPLHLILNNPVHLNNGENYVLRILLNSNSIYKDYEDKEKAIECLALAHSSNSKPFCTLHKHSSGKPLISVHGLDLLKGEVIEIIFPDFELKETVTVSTETFSAWIEEMAPGRFGHLLTNFNITKPLSPNDSVALSPELSTTASPAVYTQSLTNTQIGVSTVHQYTFTVSTTDPEYIIYEFDDDSFQVLKSEVLGDYLFFGGESNQILQKITGSNTAPFIHTFDIPAGYIKNPKTDGNHTLKVRVIKGGVAVEKFDLNVLITLAPSGAGALTLTGSFGPHASETNILTYGEHLFQSVFNVPAIPDGSCLMAEFSGIKLAMNEKLETCALSGFPAEGKCKIVDSNKIHVYGIKGVSSATALNVINKFFVNSSNSITANLSVSFNPNCTEHTLSIIENAASFTFNATVTAGNMTVKSYSKGFNYNTTGVGVHPLKFYADIPSATTFTNLAVTLPDCISFTSSYLVFLNFLNFG